MLRESPSDKIPRVTTAEARNLVATDAALGMQRELFLQHSQTSTDSKVLETPPEDPELCGQDFLHFPDTTLHSYILPDPAMEEQKKLPAMSNSINHRSQTPGAYMPPRQKRKPLDPEAVKAAALKRAMYLMNLPSKRQRVGPGPTDGGRTLGEEHNFSEVDSISESVSRVSECCSSCTPDGVPCDNPDCHSPQGGAVEHCDNTTCYRPACSDPCINEVVGNQQQSVSSSARLESWHSDSWTSQAPRTDSADAVTGGRIDPLLLHAIESIPPVTVSKSPAASTPSMADNEATPYSPEGLATPQFPHNATYTDFSATPPSNLYGLGTALDGEISQYGVQNPDFSSLANRSNIFTCAWNGCQEYLQDPNDWSMHIHQAHIDPQMTWNCPLPSDACEQNIGSNPLDHLQLSHGYQFTNLTNYSCPAPACDQETLYDPPMLHNHFDQAHAMPLSAELHCEWASCGSTFSNAQTLIDHVYETHYPPVGAAMASLHQPVGANQFASVTQPSGLNGHHSQITNGSQLNQFSGAMLFHQNNQPLPHASQLGAYPQSMSMDQHQLNHDVHNFASTSSMIGQQPETNVTQDEVVSSTGDNVCKWNTGNGLCRKTFSSPKDLQDHISEWHLQDLKKGTGFKCLWEGCDREEKLGSIKAGFSQRGKLERHMATHTTFKSDMCPTCGKGFSAPQALAQHIRALHTGEKPWKCKHCDKSFPQQSACTIHERTHTGSKPLECPICNKTFSESSNLAKHRKTHGLVGQHVCEFAGCGKAFHRLDQLKRHRTKHYKQEEDPSAPIVSDGIKSDVE